MRYLLITIATLLLLVVLFLGGTLGVAHVGIRSIHPPLPTPEAVAAAFESQSDLPVRVSYINTASQGMPRSGVLEPSLDPEPNLPYVMSLPSFVLEWADGRIFLIDTGMDREGSIEFGSPSEMLAGADPIEPKTDVAAALGAKLNRVAGIAFTHLHSDHTNGVLAFCAGSKARSESDARTPIFQTRLQSTESNYTTQPGLDLIAAADCLQTIELEAGPGASPLLAIPGFPGLGIIATGGHTPGSQMFIARVRGPEDDASRIWIFTGDLVNHIDGVRKNIPKPFLYSLLLVPEDTEWLDHMRRYLRKLSDLPGVDLLVSHDQHQLESSEISVW